MIRILLCSTEEANKLQGDWTVNISGNLYVVLRFFSTFDLTQDTNGQSESNQSVHGFLIVTSLPANIKLMNQTVQCTPPKVSSWENWVVMLWLLKYLSLHPWVCVHKLNCVTKFLAELEFRKIRDLNSPLLRHKGIFKKFKAISRLIMHNIDSWIEFTYMYGQTLITLCGGSAFNPLTPKISLVTLLTVFHTIHMILV